MASDKIGVLVLTDADGNVYAIPQDSLATYKVTPDQKAQIEQELGGDDVSGFLMLGAASAAKAARTGPAPAQSISESTASTSAAGAGATTSSVLMGSLFSLSPSLLTSTDSTTQQIGRDIF